MLSIPNLLRPVLIISSLFFTICVLLCGAASIFISVRDKFDSIATVNTAQKTGKEKKQEPKGETGRKSGLGSSLRVLKTLFDIGGTMGYLIFVALSIGRVVNAVLEGFW
ncbi:hypothetical protein ACMFMG_009959 [Clarireedia jacksonii]